ncbi:isoflavone reductase-like protein [Rhizoctonia solani AG-3 Rhs1AP]|uniref:Isoflavone reductase-like protein n=2 Tax=Rhizoctonia solani AG-3 TaxID=1086053 RepID=A0A074SFF1_9AGAM|nr:isoflavone reductase-like protein [Rhizoctonia solani AG-3 Rhs1AP]KEP48727.1 isoflavone reductase-like protein [Rhizoctonia solani 123E]
MTSKVVAIVGASGNVGKVFTDRFLIANAFQLRVLVRASSLDSPTYQAYKQRGAQLRLIDFEDEVSIVDALNGVDVFISTVAGPAWSAQFPLARAASKAGVKVFFPSEYGSDFEDNLPWPPAQIQKNVRKTAQELGLPIAILWNAAFPELVITSELGWSFAEKKVTIWGDGNTKLGWTTVRSVADWLTHVLKTVPIEQLKNRQFKIQASSYTYNEIVTLWEQKYNDKLAVEHRSLKELEDRFAANPNDVFAALMLELASGRMNIGGHDNSIYPDWQPDSVESVL